MLALALAFAFALGVASCRGPGEPARRIVLITLDTLRYDSFAGDSAHPTEMPQLRALGTRALEFRRHYAATSTTQPTHATLLTGLHPWQHGVSRNGAILPSALDTVPERLERAGYATAAVVASFPLHHRFGFSQGFARYADEFTEEDLGRWEALPVPGRRFYSRAETITARALELLDRLRGPRQFLWVHYFDPHDPYGDSTNESPIPLRSLLAEIQQAPQEAAARIARARAAYGRDVHSLDESLAALLRRLLADASEFETHILLVSDHGESFGEGGSLGHGKRLTREQIRVPLLLFSPRVEPGASDAPVGSVDVAATLLAFAGLSDPNAPGRDLTRPLPREREVVGMRRTFATPYPDLRTDGKIHVVAGPLFYAVVDGRVYRGNAAGVASSGSVSLEPARARELQSRFAAFERDLERVGVTEAVDGETRRGLEALGYVR